MKLNTIKSDIKQNQGDDEVMVLQKKKEKKNDIINMNA